jgi:4-amino-4-deoxy-L-arabinose transferase-like glycosyltransferase
MALEALALLGVCAVVFFVGLGRFDFIQTEGLRAVVAAEMLERPGLSMPTVHDVPYLKKPPLYAWTVTLLARSIGRLDEQIARLPSAVCATALVLLIYAVGEAWLGRRAGLAAACLTAVNPSVVDYGSRAELDMGFALFATATNLLAWPALRSRGARAAGWWLAVYAAATVASFWKGPHVLIFLWLMLLTWGMVRRDWHWLRNPGQWVGLLACLALLAEWTRALSAFAGGPTVAKVATRELISRLVPISASAAFSMLWYGPALVLLTLPASLFVVAVLSDGVTGAARPAGGLGGRVRAVLRTGWTAASELPFAQFLLAWAIPNLIFDVLVPGKAPRYAMAHFAPVFLLAGWALLRVESGCVAPAVSRVVELGWRGLFGVFLGVGSLALVGVLAIAAFPDTAARHLGTDSVRAWAILGLGWCGVAAICLRAGVAKSSVPRLLGLLAVLVAAKPFLLAVVWPLRAKADSMRASAAALDAAVPPGEVVAVLGWRELPDVAFYSARRFRFLPQATGAGDILARGFRHCLVREQDLGDFGLTARPPVRLNFMRANWQILLLDVAADANANAVPVGSAPPAQARAG